MGNREDWVTNTRDSNHSNLTAKIALAAILAAGVGGGVGSISSALADGKAIREIVSASPELATLRANISAIKEDMSEVRADQKDLRREQKETGRKIDRVLVVLESRVPQ